MWCKIWSKLLFGPKKQKTKENSRFLVHFSGNAAVEWCELWCEIKADKDCIVGKQGQNKCELRKIEQTNLRTNMEQWERHGSDFNMVDGNSKYIKEMEFHF